MNPESIDNPQSTPASKEVVQWLDEVKLLQQQVQDLNAELITATQNADAWRSRYEVEGKQRRAESAAAQANITKLTAEITQLRSHPELSTELGDDAIVQQIKGLINLSDLQSKLFEVWIERDKALAAIKVEQLAHEKTKKDLTMALADAMDVLVPKTAKIP